MTQAYPLQWPDGWPRTPEGERRDRSPFKTTFDKARWELYRSLELLGATSCVISSHLPLRMDGKPRADAARMRLPDPGVAVYFSRDGKQLVIAQDRYPTCHDNLRSIGLAIEGLRTLERHGGGHIMERAFTGFVALSDRAHWREVLEYPPGVDVSLDDLNARYRAMARQAGAFDQEQLRRLNAAISAAREELRS
jgi:hypothetical protein